MCEEEFIKFCENFDFPQFPGSHKQFMDEQVKVMKDYVERCHKEGDTRNETEILLEWVKGKNSNLFRRDWILEFCEGSKTESEYYIPEHFYIKRR